MLSTLRPSSEHILIVRAPGARDQHGCHSTPFRARVPRARRTIGGRPLSPSIGEYLPTSRLRTLCSSMEQTRPYQRSLYRLAVAYPTMYCVTATVGEGIMTNLSAMGCMIEADQPLLADQRIALRLMLPDQPESLPIDEAYVRWVNGNFAGIEFIQVERAANLRLHAFIWDGMAKRFHAIQQKRATS